MQAADGTLDISKLKNNLSTGLDQINIQHVKEIISVSIPYINLTLHYSINQSLLLNYVT